MAAVLAAAARKVTAAKVGLRAEEGTPEVLLVATAPKGAAGRTRTGSTPLITKLCLIYF